MKKIFTLIVALMAILTNINAVETTIWEGRQDLGSWSNNVEVGTPGGAELKAAGAQPGFTVRFYGEVLGNDWKVKVIESQWSPVYGGFAAYEYTGDDGVKYVAWDFASKGYVEMALTQEMLDGIYSKQYWGGTFIIQGQDFILTKATVVSSIDYETEGKNIPYDEYGQMLASEFNGLSDDAKVVFTYSCNGEVDGYQNWGTGELKSIDQKVNLNQNFPMGSVGEHSITLLVKDIKEALNSGPDQYNRYGLYWNLWGFDSNKAYSQRVSVKTYEVVGFMSDGYKDPTYKSNVEDQQVSMKEDNVIPQMAYAFAKDEQTVKLVIENTAAAESLYKEIGALTTIDGTGVGRKLYGGAGSEFNLYVTVKDVKDAAKSGAEASKGVKVMLNEGFKLKAVYLQKAVETGIQNVNTLPVEDGKTYNIAGQRVSNNAKGLVIRNGKKFFVK